MVKKYYFNKNIQFYIHNILFYLMNMVFYQKMYFKQNIVNEKYCLNNFKKILDYEEILKIPTFVRKIIL